MKRVIVSGATGAIGTALLNEFIKNNIEVLVLTRRNSLRNNNIPVNNKIRTVYCSLDELKSLENHSGEKYDVFFHLAWAGTSGSGRNDKELQDKNIEYALDAVQCAQRFGCKKFVGIGSQAEYGRINKPLKPEMDCHPENEYGRAKLEAGKRTRDLAHKLGLEHNWVRVLSIYGINDGENSLISYLFRKLKAKETPDLTLGEQIWDYLFSQDAAEALRLVGETGIDGKVYVLGSGERRQLREYTEIIRKTIAPEISINYGAIPYSEKQVMYLTADISDISEDVGWKPKTDFETGIRIMAENN